MTWLNIALLMVITLPNAARAATASCARHLEPTRWSSVAGSYGLLDIKGVAETEDPAGGKHYVFDSKVGPPRVFKLLSREATGSTTYLKAFGDGGGMGFRTIYQLNLRDVSVPGDSNPIEIQVKVEAENEGFRLERWAFELDGREQYLLFYDREEERRHIARKSEANAARERWLAENPDPMSKAGIRKAIVDGLIAEGLKPSENYWIDEEVERQWAEMWHDLTR